MSSQGIYVLFLILSANAISDGDKESECDEDGPSPEDSRKVNDTFWSSFKRGMKKVMFYNCLTKLNMLCFVFCLPFVIGNNGGNTVPSRGSLWPQSLQRWGER